MFMGFLWLVPASLSNRSSFIALDSSFAVQPLQVNERRRVLGDQTNIEVLELYDFAANARCSVPIHTFSMLECYRSAARPSFALVTSPGRISGE
jgi:hypothetical protein